MKRTFQDDLDLQEIYDNHGVMLEEDYPNEDDFYRKWAELVNITSDPYNWNYPDTQYECGQYLG